MEEPLATPDPLLITVAPTGAEKAKRDFPHLPTTLSELVATAESCEAAGARMIHVHVRDHENRPTLDLLRLSETVEALRESTNLIVQLSTGGAVQDSYDDRLRVLEAQPDSCSVTLGTINYGDEVFLNSWPFICELYRRTQARGIVPEFEIFDLGHVDALRRLLDEFGPPSGGAVHCDFVLGLPGCLPGTAEALMTGVAGLPHGVTSWSATGIGRAATSIALATLALGGHMRVGMEDVTHVRPRVPALNNAELVARAADLGRWAGRSSMAAEDARTLLGLATNGRSVSTSTFERNEASGAG